MIAGVSGVGKSTIIQELSRDLNLTWGDYGDLMLEVMGKKDKDEIQYLDWQRRRAVYDEVESLIAERFSKQNSDGIIHILENHLTIIQDGAVISFPVGDYEKYNLVGLISIIATPRIILDRRLKDSTRKRSIDTLELIEEQQTANAEEAVKISRYLSIPLMEVVNNKNLPILQIQRWLRNVIQEIKSPERS